MESISISLSDDLIKAFGIDAIQKLLEEELSYQKFALLEKRLQYFMIGSSDLLMKDYEKAREEAYKEYKLKRFS
jgi:hypothetical protein